MFLLLPELRPTMLERKQHQPELVLIGVLYPGQIGIWRCWFLWREENQRTQKKTLGARPELTTNSTHIWYRAGIEPGPHWHSQHFANPAPHMKNIDIIRGRLIPGQRCGKNSM